MSKLPVVKPKTPASRKPYSVSKDEEYARSLQDENTDNDEEFARQIQEQLLREQEDLDADLARQLNEEEQSKNRPMVMPFHPAADRPMTATPIRQLFQTMFGLRPETLEVEDEDDVNDTPAMDPESPEALGATAAAGAAARRLPEVIGTSMFAAGRGQAARRMAGRSPERARRWGLARSPERPIRSQGADAVSPRGASTDNSISSSESQESIVDQLPGVRANPVFRSRVRNHGPGHRIIFHHTGRPGDSEDPHPNVRPILAQHPMLREREATMNLPDGEFDPDFMVLDLGANERQREANFVNIMRDPFLLMLLLMSRDPGFMVPDNVDLGDYEALWDLAETLGEVRGRGMKEEEINKLPFRTYRRKSGHERKVESCSICISEYKTADNVQILPCQHEFHKDCLIEWLKRNASCPICRQDVKKDS